MRDDLIKLPSGEEVGYVVVVNPDSVLVVPHFDNGDTVLVRQWRHAWNASSWEVPAGTLARGEEPVAGALRELEEEAGLRAGKMSLLGAVHGAAILTGTAHLFLAEALSETARKLEPYEQDMELHRLPLAEAFAAAMAGDIEHSPSITALTLAARALNVV